MSLTGQITRRKVAAATLNGFFLTMRWYYDPGLIPVDAVLDDPAIKLLPEVDVLDDLLQFFPSSIPALTEFLTPTGGTFITEKLAFIKDFDKLSVDGIGDTPTERVLVWGATARYSYLLENDPLDEAPPPSYTPWSYPGENEEFVPQGQWPLENYDYARWVGCAQHYLTFTVQSPWGILLRPDTSAAYNLIQFSQWGGAQVVDWTTYQTVEGREPLVTFTNNLDIVGIPWRQTSQSGTRYIETWLRPQPPDQVDEGFDFPRRNTVNTPLVPHILAFALLNAHTGFLLSFVRLFSKLTNLSSSEVYGISSDEKGISSDGKGIYSGGIL